MAFCIQPHVILIATTEAIITINPYRNEKKIVQRSWILPPTNYSAGLWNQIFWFQTLAPTSHIKLCPKTVKAVNADKVGFTDS